VARDELNRKPGSFGGPEQELAFGFASARGNERARRCVATWGLASSAIVEAAAPRRPSNARRRMGHGTRGSRTVLASRDSQSRSLLANDAKNSRVITRLSAGPGPSQDRYWGWAFERARARGIRRPWNVQTEPPRERAQSNPDRSFHPSGWRPAAPSLTSRESQNRPRRPRRLSAGLLALLAENRLQRRDHARPDAAQLVVV
jgi:hypothetical protein